MKHLLVCGLFAFAGVARAIAADAVTITDADYEGRPQFKVSAAGATWFYDKAGGGFSRLLDRDGHDWIAFHRTPLNELPASAAAGFRGLPNVVFGKDNPDAGAGHPGFDLCDSVRIGERVIRTTSKSGKWAWQWEFTPTHASFTMLQADGERPWWFLYEGAIAGRFAPHEQYWGTDLGGPRRETPDHLHKGDATGQWRWIYFGDTKVPRVLFLAQAQADTLTDLFAYMGNDSAKGLEAADGMAVFGFGRGPRMLLRGAGLRFAVGFVDTPVADAAAHARVAQRIEACFAP